MQNATLAAYSRFYTRLTRRYEHFLYLIKNIQVTRNSLLELSQTLQKSPHNLTFDASLRVMRQLIMHHLIEQDCIHQAPLSYIVQSVTKLAHVSLNLALEHAQNEMDTRFGIPVASQPIFQPAIDAHPKRAQLWILGMGKLGGRELNVSSDIDLIYIYDHDGYTSGKGGQNASNISNQEYFTRVVKRITQLIGEITEHGCVFRVDLALRPNGNSGPTTISQAALQEYLQVQGREWERFAWMKSRVVAPWNSIESGAAQSLRGIVLPFVFRQYLDFNVFTSLRHLHVQIRNQSDKNSAERPERANDIKLGRGGIREIEFIVQLQQVSRGGQFPELRTRATIPAIQRLQQANLLDSHYADKLIAAYTFLRRTEHRIQYLDDQQTHILPTQTADIEWISQTMGYANSSIFLDQLVEHRQFVAFEFDRLLKQSNHDDPIDSTPLSQLLPTHSFSNFLQSDEVINPPNTDGNSEEIKETFEKIQQLNANQNFQKLRPEILNKVHRLQNRTLKWLTDLEINVQGAHRGLFFIESLLRRDNYIALLDEQPHVQKQLFQLFGAASWCARYAGKHPNVIDELANSSKWFNHRFHAPTFTQELQNRKYSLAITNEDDDESLLNLLRRSQHIEQFRILARDVAGLLTVEQVADDLSALADSILHITIEWCWQRLRTEIKHQEHAQIAIISYGKLGSKELGYGSDLDIVFVYEDNHDKAATAYSALVKKLINWLTIKTGEGDLYEIDTALRPNGESGLLVISFEAYSNYQLNRGSNTAWLWEHQAMTRARFSAGYKPIHKHFDTVRSDVLKAKRDPVSLAQEIVRMREKIRAAHPVDEDVFDIKHSQGGMIDFEFAVQYLVLNHAHNHASLVPNIGNLALLNAAALIQLVDHTVAEPAIAAYRQLRKMQHHARLNETPPKFNKLLVENQSQAILRLWNQLLS